MPADLRTINDHPAVLLLEAGDSFGHEVLRQHETIKGVTFAALSNETLDAVYQEYMLWSHGSDVSDQDTAAGYGRLARAISGLLGLADD